LNQGLEKERFETTKSVLEGHLTELKSLNLRKKWAQITSQTQEDQIKFKEETLRNEFEKNRHLERTFLKNLGFSRIEAKQATMLAKGTVFDYIFRDKPKYSRSSSSKVMSKVLEQKRLLELQRKKMWNQEDPRESLLTTALAKEEDRNNSKKAIQFQMAMT
jgi:hypothetical protein